jgi:2-C-methyl-D-erythritol 4-phosphate cytidylyltransferase
VRLRKAIFRLFVDFPLLGLMNLPRFIALIPAAGVGARMGSIVPKQYAELLGKPMLEHVMDTFVDCTQIQQVFVVVSADDAYIEDIPTKSRTQILRCGGATRQASVTNGLQAMQSQVDPNDWVLVHDAARPGLTVTLINKLIAAVKGDPVGGLLAMPVVDTIKRSDAHGHADHTVSREHLWAAQTPQMFKHVQLLSALQSGSHVTDEASAIEALGLKPKLVEGSPRNFKVTLPHDVLLAELYIKGIA